MALTCKGRCGKLKLGSIISALATRIVFCLHCLVAFWRIMASSEWDPIYSLLLSGIVGLFIETIVTLYVRKGAEYKWFCPSVFFYLSTIVPCVWILELDMLSARLSNQAEVEKRVAQGLNNTKNFDLKNKNNVTIIGVNIPIELPQNEWVMMIEQLLLFVLILGRWMLPKGKISRDELSQLLLVYIGMAADIIEFFEAFKEKRVKYNWMLITTILAIWSASLLQFTLVLTASKSKKTRAGFTDPADLESPSKAVGKCCCCKCCRCSACCSGCDFETCCGNEVCGIITTMVLQDGPFLTLRLLLLIRYEVNSYMHIFFTVKNSLVLLLMFYRLFVLFEARKEHAHALAHAHDQDDVITVGSIGRDRDDYIDLDRMTGSRQTLDTRSGSGDINLDDDIGRGVRGRKPGYFDSGSRTTLDNACRDSCVSSKQSGSRTTLN